MRVTTFSLTTALLGASATLAAPLEVRQDTLLPFEVTYVGSNNPPSVPGPYPWRYIRANFTDPNPYPFFTGPNDGSIPGGLQGIHCEAKWYRGESPEGRTWPCDPVPQGHFAIQVLPGTSASADVRDFKLKLIHGVEPGLSFSKVYGRVEAESGPFTYDNNLKGSCLKSGWCGYSATNTPFSVSAKKTV